MPRQKTPVGEWGDISVTQDGDGYTASTRFRTATKLVRVRRSGKSRAAAKRALMAALQQMATELEAEVSQAGDLSKDSTFGELCTLFLDENETDPRKGGSTRRGYRQLVQNALIPSLGEKTIRELTTGVLDRYIVAVSKTSTSQAKRQKSAISQIMDIAVRHDVIPSNPTRGVRRISHQRKAKVVLTLGDINAIRKAIQIRRTIAAPQAGDSLAQFEQILDVILGSSARIGEALATCKTQHPWTETPLWALIVHTYCVAFVYALCTMVSWLL